MINVKSLKFDADEKLLDFIDKKVGKVEKFFDNMGDIDVTLSLLPEAENKCVKLLKIMILKEQRNLEILF